MGWVEGLDAVAKVAVLSGDAVGELVEMRFACDDGTGGAETFGNRAVGGSDAVLITVKRRATGGRKICEVEAVLERDRSSPERQVGDVLAAKVARIVAGPILILGEVDIVASVAVGASECGV